MEAKVMSATTASEAAEIIVDLVEQIELPSSALFAIGVSVLVMAADATASKSKEFKAMVDNAIDKRLPTETKLVIIVRTYLEYVQKCRNEGRCACGDPECKSIGVGVEESSESSTSIH